MNGGLSRSPTTGPASIPRSRTSCSRRAARGATSQGTGLGLHLVDTLVTRYGGSVDVATREPRGTVFTVHLPLADEREAP